MELPADTRSDAAEGEILYADIVFDRPLDTAYCYAVPPSLHSTIAVGKRIEAPFGRGDTGTIGYVVRLHRISPLREVKSVERVVDEEILLTEPLLRLTRWMADYYVCGWGQVLQAVLPAGVRDQAGTREAILLEAVADSELPQPVPELTPKQQLALDKLRKLEGAIEQRIIQSQANVGPSVIKALIDKGLVRKSLQRVERIDMAEDESVEPEEPPPELNEDQQRVWFNIFPTLATCHFQTFLLYGVTGSGKTEIYLRAIEEVLKQGRQTIVLVPEISLTPQTIERFQGRCGQVAVMHSHLTDGERGAHWRRIAAGQVQVVVGARSCIFAPVRHLGLIIIDEEHEGSFKQDSTPRYHARDVGVMRAKLENIPIILGSATPSLESWANVQKKQYTLLELPNRVANRPMPEVRLIDLKHEPKRGGAYFAISPSLEDEMREAMNRGGQVILLLNRRGFSTYVHCPGCGQVATCPNCDLSMTFHRQRKSMMCHYCGHEEAPSRSCVKCKQATMVFQGLGTEKLEAELREKFPDKAVARMDSDTMVKPGSHQQVFDMFRAGALQILLGTQMIAKGLDFPNVTLVGVINADVGLHMPDFRAAERTFQLLAQVAGRAGRGELGGRVLIQTFTPEHPSILLAARHDYLTFAAQEMAHRHEHLYPPFQRLARLIIRSEREEAARDFADTLAAAFRVAMNRPDRQPPRSTGLRLLGPAEAPVFRLNRYYRFHFQMQSESPGLLHQVLREVLSVARAPSGVEYQVDIDALNML